MTSPFATAFPNTTFPSGHEMLWRAGLVKAEDPDGGKKLRVRANRTVAEGRNAYVSHIHHAHHRMSAMLGYHGDKYADGSSNVSHYRRLDWMPRPCRERKQPKGKTNMLVALAKASRLGITHQSAIKTTFLLYQAAVSAISGG